MELPLPSPPLPPPPTGPTPNTPPPEPTQANAAELTQASAAAEPLAKLPSGRTLHLASGEREIVEIRTADGLLELQIVLTPTGPLVRLAATRLELCASQTIALRCQDLDIHTTGQTRLRSLGDMHLDGATVRINCDDSNPRPAASVAANADTSALAHPTTTPIPSDSSTSPGASTSSTASHCCSPHDQTHSQQATDDG